ncbi:hypothetical protein H4582DRAFT_463894 [Lactarius indigo]|nr:hypothetical protein H4582DRAFT_463894 [Lactarius indigo]
MSPFPPLADENTPLMESDWTSDSPQGAFGVHPQDASSVPYPDLPWPLLYTLQELGLLHDGANAAQPLESLVPLGDVSQFPPPEAAQSADLATDDRAVGAPRGGNGKALHLRLCELCNRTFRRPQEFKRHMDQVHQPQRKCPFNPCAYKWQRPYKIKAHITNEHRSEFCAVDFKKVSSLRGKRIVEFVDACEFWYNSKTTAEPYLLPSLPPLAPSERFMLSIVGVSPRVKTLSRVTG